jgi:hypothetical protein
MSTTERVEDAAARLTSVMLSGARVTRGFAEALFDAANRSGMSVNEFVIAAAAERLARQGRQFPGVFHRGDFDVNNLAA